MSSISWVGNRLVQGVKQRKGELGYVAFDEHTKTHVLWLKDHDGVFTTPGSYVRGDEWPTLREAKANAAGSPTAFLAHCMWMKLEGHRYGFLAMQYGEDELENLAARHIKPVIHRTLGYEVKDLRDVSKGRSYRRDHAQDHQRV